MHDAHNEKSRAAGLTDITGVLLAGGKSLRMGHDKACIEVAGQTLVSRSFDLLRRYFTKVLIAGDRPDLAQPGIPAIPDIYPGSALGGLYTGLLSADTDWIFVAPCDMPYPDHRILELLLAHRNGFDAVVPRTPHGYEPVFALYHKNCLPQMEDMLRHGQFRIYDFYQSIAIRFLDWQELPDDWERSLLNVNTPHELARLREKQP
jgi:molybdopterin-guanine dinucleotide biosynthesis protein A